MYECVQMLCEFGCESVVGVCVCVWLRVCSQICVRVFKGSRESLLPILTAT